MKKIIFIFLVTLFSTPAFAGNSYVDGWISAMQNGGAGLNAVITPDFEYRQINFDFGKRFIREKKTDAPFFAKTSKPTSIDIEETKGGPGGQIVLLNNVSENGFYREWMTILLVRSDGIARATEIALEGQMRGYPPGCPETMYKRNFIVTLTGTPDGFSEPKMIKLYTYRRDTDPIAYAHPSLDEKEREKCTPTPDKRTTFSEVIVFDTSNQAESVSTVAIKSDGTGGIFFKEDGVNFPGRLFSFGGGKDGLLLTFTTSKDSEMSDIAKLYVWRGSSWKSVWGFDVGHGVKSGLGGSFSRNVEWGLRSSSSGAGPEIIARLDKNNNPDYACPTGTNITFQKSGSGFSPAKSGQPDVCFKRDMSGNITASPGKDEKAKYEVSAEDVDWRFK